VERARELVLRDANPPSSAPHNPRYLRNPRYQERTLGTRQNPQYVPSIARRRPARRPPSPAGSSPRFGAKRGGVAKPVGFRARAPASVSARSLEEMTPI